MITKKLYPTHTETVVVSARIPVPLLKKIDRLCAKTNRTKSDLIVQILSEYDYNFNEQFCSEE